MAELWELPATELAAAIARGEISSVDATRACIARVEAVDGILRAVVVRRFETALAEAARADAARANGAALGALHGVPVTIKETLDVAGTPSTYGIAWRAQDRAPADDPYVARWRAAGAIVIGKTNVSQLTLFVESDNPVYGRTSNPWNLARSPGGSSGGESAIVAAGGSPLGLGTDIGGSLRAPACFTGIASLKPTAGVLPDVSRLRVLAGQTAIVSQVGPLARTVDDVALGWRVASRATQPNAPIDYAGLRIGTYASLGSFAPAPALARASREAAAFFERIGARVAPFEPANVAEAMELFYGILAADGTRGARKELGGSPRDPRIAELLRIASLPRPAIVALVALLRATGEPSVAAVVNNYGRHDTYHYWRLVDRLERYRARFAAALDAHPDGPLDLIVCPPTGLPALRHGASAMVFTMGAYAPLYNVLGYPCGTVPFTRVRTNEAVGRKAGARDRMERAAYDTECESAGLPAGVQIVGRPGREDLVLAAMRALEAAARTDADFPVTPVTPTYAACV